MDSAGVQKSDPHVVAGLRPLQHNPQIDCDLRSGQAGVTKNMRNELLKNGLN
jgi:hypothetical protein